MTTPAGDEVPSEPGLGVTPANERSTPDSASEAPKVPKVLVVGSGWRFTSGISYYTCSLANAFSRRWPTRALLMRRLIPRWLYPGRDRVGTKVNALDYDPAVDVFDGLDWFWGPSLWNAIRFLRVERPDVVVFQWWTGAVVHSYIVLALAARRLGARVVVEWHEVQDTGEARIPGVTRYVSAAVGAMMHQVDAHVVHSAYDLDLLVNAYGLEPDSVEMVPHGPYEYVVTPGEQPDVTDSRVPPPGLACQDESIERASDEPITVLYFGIIRPYKGLEYLVRAFDRVPQDLADRLRLLVVGETWEGWDLPLQEIASSPRRDQITVVNRYVDDAEVAQFFAQADAVVLPYLRSSSSGPLAIAMSSGLPVILSRVGGLVEAAESYGGVRFIEPADVDDLVEALGELPGRVGQRYVDVRSWSDTTDRYAALFERIMPAGPTGS